MMRINSFWNLFIIIIILSSFSAKAQDQKSWTIGGYLKYLHTAGYQEFDGPWHTNNLIHNRLNFKWYTGENSTFVAEFRNRFMYGDGVETNPLLKETIEKGNGYVDLSFIPFSGTSYLMATEIDRLYFDLYAGDWQFRIGKQRINWGQNLVWNPNDVFNAFSYFDFDYEERPGTDAVKIAYYPDYASKAEFIYEAGKSLKEMSFAGLYRFNKWEYDIQFLGGFVRDNLFLGTGWSGHIKGAAFRGEFSYFNFDNETGENINQLIWSVSGDYTFDNQFYAHLSYIYNSEGSTEDINISDLTLFRQTTAKTLTLSRSEIFWQVSYPVAPLIKADLAGIVNPFDGSFFTGPSATFSVKDNIELLLTGQLFYGPEGTLYGDIGKLWYGRLRWSF